MNMLKRRRKIYVFLIYIAIGIAAYYIMNGQEALEHYRIFMGNLTAVTLGFFVGNIAEHAKDFIETRRNGENKAL
jgi:UDP-N-acetylmuramyl pentapeptide phosphotransferase/UDP-N-acetylglucosamine-1-phosphate transferase